MLHRFTELIPVGREIIAALLDIVHIHLELTIVPGREWADLIFISAVLIRLEPGTTAIGKLLVIKNLYDIVAPRLWCLILVVILEVASHVNGYGTHFHQLLMYLRASGLYGLLHRST